jgi:quinohemoprotein amine dehydrogenase
MKRIALLFLVLPFVWMAAPRAAQQPAMPAPAADASAGTNASDEGIPVMSDLVKRKCGTCHKADEKGRLSRISYRRTTPEGWELTIKRMVALNNVKIEPAEARDVLRYLSDHQGLAPDEATPSAFEVEHRQIDFEYASDHDPDKDKQITNETCTACHSMGRVISQRRTKDEWSLLVAMHRGYYWLVDFQAFRRTGPPRREPGPDGRPPDNRHPMDVAISHLSSAFPLTTPEWSAWSATMRPPQLKGTWALSGYEAGKGPIFGTVTIAPQGAADSAEFTTQTTYTIPRTGEHVTRTGRALVYTGYQWRGRSNDAAAQHELREVMFINPDWRHAEGRWFTGAYDEFGIDVRLDRVGGDPVVTGISPSMLRAGASGQELHVFGAHLPAQLAAADVNLGPGLTVDRIVSAAPDEIVLATSAAKSATPGRRSVFVAGAAGDATVAVYDTVDFIKVTPQAGLARVGGVNFPKQYQQFEAIASANGPDGRSDTKDDIALGLVDASWSIEEYTATFTDDDKDFVGAIDGKSGLFTPNVDGPNPKRPHNANNYGDVWVVATYQPAGGNPGGPPLKARAHLLVTVPIYMKWDQPEVGR